MEKVNRNITHFIVHCSYTKPSMDVDVHWIDRLHRKQGYAQTGYNFFYKRDGQKQMGRSLQNFGAHTIGVGSLKGANRYSIGACYSGGMSEDGKPEDNITVDQWLAILKDFRAAMEIYPDIKIAGHNQFDKKQCPCFDVRDMARKHGIPEENIEQREPFM